DGSQSSPGNVGAAVEWVDEAWLLAAGRPLHGWGVSLPGRARRPPGHRVHGEVASGEVGLERRSELDPVRSAEVGVVVVAAERRDLVGLAAAPDRDGPEPVLVDGARKELDRLLWKR